MDPNSNTPQYQNNPVVPQQPQMPLPQNGGGNMMKWIVIIVVALVVGGGILGLMLRSNKNSTNSGGTNSSFAGAESAQIALLAKKGAALTASDVSGFNATDLFFGAFRNAAEQQTVTSDSSFYQTANLNDQPDAQKIDINETGYNYSTKQFTYQNSTYYPDTQDSELTRCVNGKSYTYGSLFAEGGWQAQTGSSATYDCGAIGNTNLNDGLNTGGLSAAQANKFIDALRNNSGLFSGAKASFTTFQNKPYVRLDITVNQIADPSGGKLGVGFFDKAFGATGLDASTWPYVTSAASVSGIHISYFVDPTTQLPAYSQFAYTPPTTGGAWDNLRTVYNFKTIPTMTTSPSDVAPLTMAWPVATL